jgi:hypothetical protein
MHPMKTTKRERDANRAKDERRARRQAKGRHRIDRDGVTLLPLGGAMEPELFERLYRAVRGFDPHGPWSSVQPLVLPMLKRVHHPYPPDAAPTYLHVPPGVWAGFGIDVGPAFTHVTADQVDRWGIDEATLLASALDNLRRCAIEEPPQVERLEPDGVETIAIQAQGWGSALILAPDRLAAILGATPRVLLAPVRNTLLALPDGVEMIFATRLWDALAEGCHDELDVEPMRWTGAAVVTLAGAAEGLPN